MSDKVVEKEPEFTAADGTVRKAHYGNGIQPWDIIKNFGWGAPFAAGNALKYVRRFKAKNGQDDLEKGQWYYAELSKMVNDGDELAKMIKDMLDAELTQEEKALLTKN